MPLVRIALLKSFYHALQPPSVRGLPVRARALVWAQCSYDALQLSDLLGWLQKSVSVSTRTVAVWTGARRWTRCNAYHPNPPGAVAVRAGALSTHRPTAANALPASLQIGITCQRLSAVLAYTVTGPVSV